MAPLGLGGMPMMPVMGGHLQLGMGMHPLGGSMHDAALAQRHQQQLQHQQQHHHQQQHLFMQQQHHVHAHHMHQQHQQLHAAHPPHLMLQHCGLVGPAGSGLGSQVSPGSDATALALPTPTSGARAGDAHGHGGGGAGGLLLQGHQSNDSIMLQQIMDQILDDDDVLSDPAISKQLLGSPSSSPLLHARLSGGGVGGADAQGSALARSSTWPQAWEAGQQQQQQQQQMEAPAPYNHHQHHHQLQPQASPMMRTSSCGAALMAAPQPAAAQTEPQPAGGAPQQPQPQQPGQPQPQMMRMLCAQLQQENMLLMQRVHSLQERLGGGPAVAASDASVSPSGWHGPAAAAGGAAAQDIKMELAGL
jgi:hypothetical protein